MITLDGEVACDSCGKILEVGDYPFCPHGAGTNARIHDDIPGGMVLENYGPNTVTVYSHTERRRLMAEAGLELKERFSPMPGTDIDPAGVMNPKGYVDATTLANGAELICRQQLAGNTEAFDGVRDGVIRNLKGGSLTQRDAKAIASGDVRRQARLGQRLGH